MGKHLTYQCVVAFVVSGLVPWPARYAQAQTDFDCGVPGGTPHSATPPKLTGDLRTEIETEKWTKDETCAWSLINPSDQQRLLSDIEFAKNTLGNTVPVDNPYKPSVPADFPALRTNDSNVDRSDMNVVWNFPSINQRFANELLVPSVKTTDILRGQMADADTWWNENKERYISKCGQPTMTTSTLPDGLLQSAALCMIWTSNNPDTFRRRFNGGRFKPNLQATNCKDYEDHSSLSCPATPPDPKAGGIIPGTNFLTALTGWFSSLTGAITGFVAVLAAIATLFAAFRKRPTGTGEAPQSAEVKKE